MRPVWGAIGSRYAGRNERGHAAQRRSVHGFGRSSQAIISTTPFQEEASYAGLLSPELAAGIRRVKGVKQLGVRLGNWLTAEEGNQRDSSFRTKRHPLLVPHDDRLPYASHGSFSFFDHTG